MPVHASIEPLGWESEFFQRQSAKLIFPTQPRHLTRLSWLLLLSFRLKYLLIALIL